MSEDDPFELEGEENFIPSIFNYCDRWCERCAFTSRCRVYAMENEGPDDPESRDITNAKFWRKLELIFKQTHEMIEQWAKEAGVDLAEADTNAAIEEQQRKKDNANNHKLAVAARNYAQNVSDWFKEESSQPQIFDDSRALEPGEDRNEETSEASEVIHWYQYQIAAKIIRGLMGRKDEEEEQWEEDIPKDSDGSIKVALIAMDRSISAWRIMQMLLPDRADSIVPMLVALERLRQATEQTFPEAKDFIRPGFDEISDELIN
jgi:hypothetical protein